MKKNKIHKNHFLILSLIRRKKEIKEVLKKQFGFTLFELLVSISIIGILTALAMVSYSGAQKKARDTRRMEDIKLIQSAAEQYYYLQNTYSYPASSLFNAGEKWTTVSGVTILESYPSDPKGIDYESYGCATDYNCSPEGYCICAKMENALNANASASCDFSPAAVKTSFCVKNQQ